MKMLYTDGSSVVEGPDPLPGCVESCTWPLTGDHRSECQLPECWYCDRKVEGFGGFLPYCSDACERADRAPIQSAY